VSDRAPARRFPRQAAGAPPPVPASAQARAPGVPAPAPATTSVPSPHPESAAKLDSPTPELPLAIESCLLPSPSACEWRHFLARNRGSGDSRAKVALACLPIPAPLTVNQQARQCPSPSGPQPLARGSESPDQRDTGIAGPAIPETAVPGEQSQGQGVASSSAHPGSFLEDQMLSRKLPGTAERGVPGGL